MPHDWRTAYIAQAKSDYRILRKLLDDSDIPDCHKLHYLQMVTEKLAKGFLTPPGGGPYAKVHDAFVRFVRSARSMPNIQTACGFAKAEQFRNFMDARLVTAQLIEDLSPEGVLHPNPEYPWLAGGTIYCPCEYVFANLDVRSPQMIKMIQFLEVCIRVA